MDLAVKVKALADQCANLGSFCVCDPRGDAYLISGVTDDAEQNRPGEWLSNWGGVLKATDTFRERKETPRGGFQ